MWFQREPRPKQEDPRLARLDSLDRDELLKLAKGMVADWRELNRIYNKAANRHGWCSTYEINQAIYNTQFRVFQLRGRNDADEAYAKTRAELNREHYKKALL